MPVKKYLEFVHFDVLLENLHKPDFATIMSILTSCKTSFADLKYYEISMHNQDAEIVIVL